jgi:hypothetical protein
MRKKDQLPSVPRHQIVGRRWWEHRLEIEWLGFSPHYSLIVYGMVN